MGNRSAVDLAQGLDEDEAIRVGLAFEEMVKTEGWQYLLQMTRSAVKTTINLIHDPNASKDYVSGMIKAIETIPANVEYLIGVGRDLRESKKKQQEEGRDVLPFVRPGGTTPAL